MPTEVEIAWAAGFFEGEGCFGLNKSGGGRYRYGTMRLASTDRDVLLRFVEIVGVGWITEKGRKEIHHKVQWEWHASSRQDFETVSRMLEPYLGKRRKKRLAEIRRSVSKIRYVA